MHNLHLSQCLGVQAARRFVSIYFRQTVRQDGNTRFLQLVYKISTMHFLQLAIFYGISGIHTRQHLQSRTVSI
jgi:hypothetical protein